MPEFFLELFSEEIPARMQAHGVVELGEICAKSLAAFGYAEERIFYGPRRLAVSAQLPSLAAGGGFEEIRGPREGAPQAALEGFLRKYGVDREQLIIQNGFYVLLRGIADKQAKDVILGELGLQLAKLRWPKAMRWGQGGDFAWVRPLRRIVCLLDGEVIPLKLGPVTASNETEGHRFLAPEAFTVLSAVDWEEQLRQRFVVADYEQRRNKIVHLLTEAVGARRLTVAHDEQLVDEVTGLVEWPLALIGKIDEDFMDLPPEVRELSMKVNQRYFALRDSDGKPAPYFAFVTNIEAKDGGEAIIAGNERVLRARLSDARHFWDLDLKKPLNELLPKLDEIVFHAKIGSQSYRAEWIAETSESIAELLHADEDVRKQAKWAGRLSKADLVTGMVGEFPELQGIMGGYYAERNPRGWDGPIVGAAIKTHYQPRGPSDQVPAETVAMSVALADKLVTLVLFFKAGEKPTGSGDPYALRRAALGVIRIILENQLSLSLKQLVRGRDDVFDFIIERLRVKSRTEGKRFDVLDAVLGSGSHEDLVDIMQRVNALSQMLNTDDGKNLHAAYKRAANILRTLDLDGRILNSPPSPGLYEEFEEKSLAKAIAIVTDALFDKRLLQNRQYEAAMSILASLRSPIDSFLTKVTIDSKLPEIRENRLRLLASFCWLVDRIADFSKIEG